MDCRGELRLSVGTVPVTTPTEERFICEGCEYKCLAFDDVHTRKHALARAVEKGVETVSTEERPRTVEARLERTEVLLSKHLEKGTEGSPTGAITKRDIRAIAEGSKNTESNDQETKSSNQETAATTSTGE